MNEDQLDWQAITDFRPGIVQRAVAGVAGTPFGLGLAGSAQAGGTFGCYALPTGQLCPLPAQDYTFNIAFNPGYTSPIVFQSGMVLTSQGQGGSYTIPDIGSLSGNAGKPWVGMYAGYIFANPGANLMQHKYYRWALYDGFNSTDAGVTHFIVQNNGVAGPGRASGVYAMAFSTINSPATAPTRDVAFYSEDQVGNPILQQSDSGLLGAAVCGQLLLAHQTRVVSLANLANQPTADASGDVWQFINEKIQFTVPFSYTAGGPSYLGPEVPYGYGIVASQNASDLLMVKHAGGGLLVQGDLSTPIVRRMPEMASTGGATMYGTGSPVGFVYGQNNGGVYSWSGADTSQLLSSSLQDGFWEPPAWSSHVSGYRITPYRGKFAYWKDWVVCPNGWLYDTLTGGWWLLQAQADTNCSEFQVDPFTNRLFGAIPYSTTTNNTLVPMILGWNPATFSSTYQWTSNPLWMLADKPYTYGECREIILEVQGAGNLSVAWQTDETGGAFVNQTNISLAATDATVDVPTRIRIDVPQTPVPVRGTWVSLQLTANSAPGTAPLIWAIRWASKPVTHLRGV